MTFLSMLRAITVFVAAVFIGLIFNFWHDDGELGGIELFLAILVSGIIWIGFVILLILADNDARLARASEDYARARGYPTGPDPAESIDEVSLSASDDSATDDSGDSTNDDSASDDSASDDSATPPVSPEASPAITRSNAFRVADGAGVGNLVPLVGLIPGGELR